MKKLIAFSLTLAAATFAFAGDPAKKPMSDAAACCAEECSLVTVYDKVAKALAADDLAGAQTANKELACWASCSDAKDLTTQIEAFGKAASIADARKIFKALSAALIPLADKEGAHYVMYCPMADAEWMQTDATVANPYFGKSMLRCGDVKRKVASKT